MFSVSVCPHDILILKYAITVSKPLTKMTLENIQSDNFLFVQFQKAIAQTNSKNEQFLKSPLELI